VGKTADLETQVCATTLFPCSAEGSEEARAAARIHA